MRLRAGIRSAGKGSQPAEQNEYDGIPMLEPEWTRWRTATAYRMACELDQIRVEMLAMFESAANNEARVPPLPSAAKHVLHSALNVVPIFAATGIVMPQSPVQIMVRTEHCTTTTLPLCR